MRAQEADVSDNVILVFGASDSPRDRQFRYLLIFRTLSVEAEVQFAPGQSRTLAWTKATPAWNGAPLALAANRYDSC
jgi:hypothetical protein